LSGSELLISGADMVIIRSMELCSHNPIGMPWASLSLTHPISSTKQEEIQNLFAGIMGSGLNVLLPFPETCAELSRSIVEGNLMWCRCWLRQAQPTASKNTCLTHYRIMNRFSEFSYQSKAKIGIHFVKETFFARRTAGKHGCVKP